MERTHVSNGKRRIRSREAYDKEKPLHHGAVVIRFCLWVKPEFVFFIMMLSEVKKDGRSFKDGKTVTRAVHNGRDPTVRVEFNKP